MEWLAPAGAVRVVDATFLAFFHVWLVYFTIRSWDIVITTWNWMQQHLLVFLSSALLLFAFRGILRWNDRRRIARRLQVAALGPGKPTLDPNRDQVVFVAQGFTSSEKLVDVAVEVGARIVGPVKKRGVAIVEVAKTQSSEEQWELMAMRHARDVRGLSYLPPRVADPIQLYIALEYLSAANAPEAAKALIRARLEERDPEGHEKKSVFFNTLFNPEALRAVDKNPASGEQDTYFSKFFQPLMVNFADQTYSRSAGNIDEQDALQAHLRHLSERRVAAVRLSQRAPHIDPDILLSTLPRKLPGSIGKKKERDEVGKWNREKAVRAILIVSEPGCLGEAEIMEKLIEAGWERSGLSPNVWTPITDPLPQTACFLWQENR